MNRHKVNVKQVCASIRRDLIEHLGIEVPTDDIHIIWKGGDRTVSINVKTRVVWGDLEGRIMLEGKI